MKLFIFLKSQKSLVSSFETHNLEGSQMYYKNISRHLALLQTNKKKIIFVKKKNLQNCYFFK